MKGTAKYSCMNLSGRQIVTGRRYQETDSCLYQICISDWCGVKSFTPPVERCKALVQQEQISDVLQTRGETGDQILNSFIEPKHNPCNSLWLYESHQRKLGYRYLKRYLFKPETSPPLIKRINKFWKAIKKECNWNSSVSIQKPKALTNSMYWPLPPSHIWETLSDSITCIWKTTSCFQQWSCHRLPGYYQAGHLYVLFA